MLSNPIIAMIEEELERLRKIRTILLPLLGLTGVPKVRRVVLVSKTTPEPRTPVAPTVTRLAPRVPRRRGPRTPKPVEVPVALKGLIPTSPVVVRPSVPKLVETKPEPKTEIAPGSFAALVRAAERKLQPVSCASQDF